MSGEELLIYRPVKLLFTQILIPFSRVAKLPEPHDIDSFVDRGITVIRCLFQEMNATEYSTLSTAHTKFQFPRMMPVHSLTGMWAIKVIPT